MKYIRYLLIQIILSLNYYHLFLITATTGCNKLIIFIWNSWYILSFVLKKELLIRDDRGNFILMQHTEVILWNSTSWYYFSQCQFSINIDLHVRFYNLPLLPTTLVIIPIVTAQGVNLYCYMYCDICIVGKRLFL